MSHVAVTLSQAGNMGDLKRRSLPAVTTSWWWVGFLLVVTLTWTTSHSKPLEPLDGTTGTVLEVGKLEVGEICTRVLKIFSLSVTKNALPFGPFWIQLVFCGYLGRAAIRSSRHFGQSFGRFQMVGSFA